MFILIYKIHNVYTIIIRVYKRFNLLVCGAFKIIQNNQKKSKHLSSPLERQWNICECNNESFMRKLT